MVIESTYVASTNQLEKDVVAIWEKFLDQHPIGVNDDFFELGGHSLMALGIIAEIEIELGIPVPLAAFAQARSIDNLTRYLREQGSWSHLIALQSKGISCPFFCAPTPSVSTGMIFEDLAKNSGEDQTFYG
jgi:acyl carrier protein